MNFQRIAVIEFDDASAGQLIRLHLEQLGFDVALNRPGKPSDFFSAFQFHGQSADAAIIAAHGDEAGFIFPEMAAHADQLVLPDNRITPVLISHQLRSAPPLVVSTACSTGTEQFASAFKTAGAESYIAPLGDPAGRDVPLWVAAFFHGLIQANPDLARGIARANGLLESDSQFRLFV